MDMCGQKGSPPSRQPGDRGSEKMSVNSSSDASFDMITFLHICKRSRIGFYNITAFVITVVLVVLPLCIFVLYLGLRRRRSPMSHSDIFTYNMVATELLSLVGSSFLSLQINLKEITMVSYLFLSMNLCIQISFHVLTCMERYLAVVHPVTYLSLKTTKGIRIRNVAIGCVWLLSFVWAFVMYIPSEADIDRFNVISMAIIFSVMLFSSVSTLCVLIRPGPGEGGGGRQKVDQSKLRAFYTIAIILGVLWMRFGYTVLASALLQSPLQLGPDLRCGMWVSLLWVSLPSSLVLPLLFLHRRGKLPCCKSTEPRHG